jgi:hypothetical protein
MAIDWNAVKAQGAPAAPSAPPPPASGGIDWHAVKQGGPAAAAPPSVLGQVGNAAKTLATGVGNAMDAQRYGVAKLLTGKDNTDDQRTAERQAVGTQGIYDAMGHIPLVGHALQGASDVVQDTVTDPLTYETFGAGPILKGLGLADKAAVAMDRVGKAVTDTPLGAAVHDFTHWGGAVARDQGTSMVNRLRGTSNLAGATGANVQKKLLEDFDNIDKGLSDTERLRVGKALNGEQIAEGGATGRAALTPKEQTAYDGLRSLTEQDLEHRTKTAQIIAFNDASKGLSDEDAALLKKALDTNTAPDVPAAGKRIRVPGHGDSVGQRSREINKDVPMGIDVFRYQRTPGEAQAGSERGGTFYAMGKPGPEDHYAQDAWFSKVGLNPVGGEHQITAQFVPKNPLNVGGGHVGVSALKAIYGDDVTKKLVDFFVKDAKGLANWNEVPPEAVQLLRDTGMVPKEGPLFGTTETVTPYEKFINAANEDLTLVLDRIGLEAAKAKGYDAVIAKKGIPGKTDEFVDLGAPKGPGGTIGDLPKPQAPFTRPLENQADVDRMTKLRDLYTNIQAKVEQNVPKREDYFPTAHVGEPLGESAAAKTVSEKDYYDPRTKERDDVHVTDAAQMRAGFEAMARNTGRQVKTGVINGQLGRLLDDPEIDKLFQRTIAATGDARTNTQKVKDAWLKVIGYPRAATVSLTPRHGMNILDLAANTVPPHLLPKYTADVTKLTKQLLSAKSEDAYQALTKEGRDLGALSGDFRERQAFFQQFPGWMPGVGGKSTGPLGAYTAMNNKLVWAIDEAAKQTYAKLLVDTGEATGLEAGGLASSRLVDYTHTSPMVQALKYVAPFGTFRGSVPGAVVGGIVRNPARAALLNRATGGTMYGSRPGKGQSGAEFYGPTSDVARGLDAPQDFIRGTLGQPVQAAATMGIEAATGNPGASAQTTLQELRDLPNQIMRGQFSKMGVPGKISPYAKAVALRTARYLNYRHPIDLQFLTDWAASGVPEAGAVLEMLGHSQFSNPNGPSASSMGNEALRQSTGISIR